MKWIRNSWLSAQLTTPPHARAPRVLRTATTGAACVLAVVACFWAAQSGGSRVESAGTVPEAAYVYPCQFLINERALAPARATLAAHPTQFRVAVVGDSTRDGREGVAKPYYPALQQALRFVPAENLFDFGHNGAPASYYANQGQWLDEIVASKASIVEISIGLNDLRLNQFGGQTLTQNIDEITSTLSNRMPETSIVLSIPNPPALDDPQGFGYVQGADGSINPPGAPQAMARELRAAYLASDLLGGRVAVNDNQSALYGLEPKMMAESPLLADQLHPNYEGMTLAAKRLASLLDGSCQRNS